MFFWKPKKCLMFLNKKDGVVFASCCLVFSSLVLQKWMKTILPVFSSLPATCEDRGAFWEADIVVWDKYFITWWESAMKSKEWYGWASGLFGRRMQPGGGRGNTSGFRGEEVGPPERTTLSRFVARKAQQCQTRDSLLQCFFCVWQFWNGVHNWCGKLVWLGVLLAKIGSCGSSSSSSLNNASSRSAEETTVDVILLVGELRLLEWKRNIVWWNPPVMQGMPRLHPQGYPRSSPIA